MSKYEDIIHLPHHVSTIHPQMSLHDRAAQFSPFAALTGHSGAIEETARLTESKIMLDENAISAINEQLNYLQEQLRGRTEAPEVTITYFIPDLKKAGGRYVTIQAAVKKIDDHTSTLVMTDGTIIPMQDIIQIEAIRGTVL